MTPGDVLGMIVMVWRKRSPESTGPPYAYTWICPLVIGVRISAISDPEHVSVGIPTALLLVTMQLTVADDAAAHWPGTTGPAMPGKQVVDGGAPGAGVGDGDGEGDGVDVATPVPEIAMELLPDV